MAVELVTVTALHDITIDGVDYVEGVEYEVEASFLDDHSEDFEVVEEEVEEEVDTTSEEPTNG